MATDITMPKLSDTMTEGRLISWKKSVGDRVERGDIIAEVETDKANMELEAFSAGVLLEVRVKPGDLVPVGTVIGVIGAAGEKTAAVQPEQAVAETMKAAAEKPTAAPVPEQVPAPEREKKPAAKAPSHLEENGKASPLVRRLAREHGIDLAQVPGTGPEGRILQTDLEKFLQVQGKGEKKEGGKPGEKGKEMVVETTEEPLTRMRHAIARTVSDAWKNIPHFTVTVAIDMEEAEKVHRELKTAGVHISLNDIVVKGAALAIAKFPLINASFTGEGLVQHREVNIGIAVSLDEGLLIPVIKGCQGLSLKEIGARSRDLIDRARKGAISEVDLTGGTFSISNMGMYGIESFSAIIFPPQGAILAVGSIQDEAVVKDGRVVPARMMRATVSADHRLVDGAYAARFMVELKRVLETPLAMLV